MDPGPLDLRDYLSILWARKGTIIAIAVTTTAVALIFSFRQTPVYTSSAELIVLPASFDPTAPSGGGAPVNMTKEQQVANSARVTRQASLRLAEREITPGTMSASEIEFAETLVFTSESPDPRAAQATAQAHAEAYLDLRRSDLIDELNGAREPYESQIEAIEAELMEVALGLETAEGLDREALNIRQTILLSQQISYITKLNELATPENIQAGRMLRSAERPGSPSAPNHTRNGLLALLVGFALGIGAAFFRDRLDERVRGREELEQRSGAPVLALIPRARSKNNDRPITLSWPESEAAEAFTALGVRLIHAVNQRPAASIIITSSLAGEGKTSVIANLGVALATTGKRVVMVSADLRRPRLQTYFRGSDFQRSGGAGLTEVLSGRRKAQDALSTTGTKNLWVLHAGGKADSMGPSGQLGSESMAHLLAELRDFADFVLIDTPPLLTASDVVALAPLTDGVLFVVDPRLAHRSNVEQARHELELIGVPIIGVVVNKHDHRRFRAYGSGHSYYGDGRAQYSGDSPSRTLRAISAQSEYPTAIPPSDRDAGDQSLR